jgi:hypothetical protein
VARCGNPIDAMDHAPMNVFSLRNATQNISADVETWLLDGNHDVNQSGLVSCTKSHNFFCVKSYTIFFRGCIMVGRLVTKEDVRVFNIVRGVPYLAN